MSSLIRLRYFGRRQPPSSNLVQSPNLPLFVQGRMLLWAITLEVRELPTMYSTNAKAWSSHKPGDEPGYSMPFGRITAMYDRLWTGIGQNTRRIFGVNPGGGTTSSIP